MSQRRLLDAVDRVESRVMRLGSWRVRTLSWVILAAIAALLVLSKRSFGSGLSGLQITGVLAGGVVLSLIVEMFVVRRRSVLETARDIEAAHPDLDDTLLTALEQQAEWPAGQLRYLQTVVIDEALSHPTHRRWSDVVPASRLRAWTGAGIASLALFLTCSVFAFDRTANAVLGEPEIVAEDPAWRNLGDIAVEPGDTEIESGSSLLVMARFESEMPAEAWLNIKPKTGDAQRFPMKLGHDKNLLLARVPAVTVSGRYSIDYDESHTEDFQVTVFTVPALEQVDAVISYPKYTNLPAKTVQDTRRVTVVEGSTVEWKFRLNKPVAMAELRLDDGTALELGPIDGEASSVRGVKMMATETRKYTLHLADDSGRENRFPPDIKLSVLENRRPDLKLAFPGKDQAVSPLEEMTLEAKVSDDFGLPEYGLIYGLAGYDTNEMKLGEDAAPKVKHSALATLPLEEMKAEPDQLVSYYFYADDFGPDGNRRRTLSDMYFAEVRKFEQIFRQGQQQQGQQQQQQGQGQQSQQGQQMQQLARLQKQIMTATWNLLRRPSLETRDPQGIDQAKEDAKVLSESQQTAKGQVQQMAEKLQDPAQQLLAESVMTNMDSIIQQFAKFDDDASTKSLQEASRTEQLVYQTLLKLRAREAEVQRQQQQQQQGQQGQQNQDSRQQQQLNQLELDNKRNRYEQEQQAQEEKPTVDQQQLRVLNRLKELARRQQAINEKLKQLESELRQAKDEEEREEIERQLKRLRDEQQQMLRDIDETLEEVEKMSENLDNPDQVQQQTQQAREQARRTSEALKNNQVSKAISEGTRTERDLKELRDDFRKETASEFEDAMRQMRQDIRDVEEKQKEISEGLAEKKNDQRKTLRSDDNRDRMAQDLQKQAERVAELSQQMREVVQQSEDTEPLLARKLYEAARELKDKPPEKDLQAERFLVGRGFMDQAREADKQAREGIEQMKKGIEQAAETVLGNELDGLRRAQRQLEQLENELGTELAQNDPEAARRANEAAEERQRRAAEARRERNGEQRGTEQREGERNQQDRRPGNREGQQSREGQPKGEPRDQQQPGRNGEPREGQQQKEGQQPRDGQRQGVNQQREGQREGQPREGQPGQQQREGQRPGQQQQGNPGEGQQRDGNQQGGQPRDGEQPEDGQQRPGQPREGQRPAEPQNSQRGGGLRNLQPRQQPQRGDGRGGNPQYAPLTGEEYKGWVDRMRDVEEMLDDPELRADVARIRDRARGIRADYKRHSKEPQWELVRKELLKPLVELQSRINEEIAKRESKDSLVPIDRDPVPNRYAEMVRRYYEELGRDHSQPVGARPKPNKPALGAEE